VDLTHFLVEHGADVTAQDNKGLTPIHWAVLKGREGLARFLLENGADPATQDNDGSTPYAFSSELEG
jgi:ankyrin repeat protein